MEGFLDESGLFAVFGHRDAASLVHLGLHALQHRGAAGAALAASDGHLLRFRRGAGLVREAVSATTLDGLPGALALGQVWGRPPPDVVPAETDGDPGSFGFGRTSAGPVAVALSGRFTNGARLRRDLLRDGAVLHGASDAELFLHLVARSAKSTFVNRVVDAVWRVEGAWALLVGSEDRLVAVRDPAGFRPLVVGRLGEATVLSTEDGALRSIGAEVRREVAPGEMLILHERRAETVTPLPRRPLSRCLMEHLSAARADATVFGTGVHHARGLIGERLARAHPCPEADVVVGLAGGGGALAAGFARVSGQPWEAAFLGEGAVPRRADDTSRGRPEAPGAVEVGVRLQARVIPGAVADRTVVLVTPALVTGHLLRKVVRLLLDAGASGVHVRSASPRARATCVYGLRPPTSDELLSVDGEVEIAEWLGARSIRFLPLEELRAVLGDAEGGGLCEACLTGVRPVVPEEGDDQLPLF